MTLLYGRRVEVTIAELTIRDLKIAFDLERQPDETTPSGEIEIYNLRREQEDRIHARGTRLRIDAGYETTAATIFDGSVERVIRDRESTARITRIEVGGMATGTQRLGGTTSRSYDGPESIRRIVSDLVTMDLRLELGPLDAIPAEATVPRWAWFNPTFAGVQSILRRIGVHAYEDDGVIRFTRRGVPQSDAARIVLSPETGLIGRPSLTDDGAEAVSFLMPLARIGGVVEVRSATVTGEWIIAGVRHRGDNYDGDFETAYDLRAIA